MTSLAAVFGWNHTKVGAKKETVLPHFSFDTPLIPNKKLCWIVNPSVTNTSDERKKTRRTENSPGGLQFSWLRAQSAQSQDAFLSNLLPPLRSANASDPARLKDGRDLPARAHWLAALSAGAALTMSERARSLAWGPAMQCNAMLTQTECVNSCCL